MLYIIYGASGSGKTTLLTCVLRKYGESAVHRKGTTRNMRQYDDFEIESFPDGLPKERYAPPFGYVYSSYGYEYGIEKKQIDEALERKVPHFVICNDIETIRQIKMDYKAAVRVIYFQFDAPRERILEIQRLRNITDDEINLRMSKIDYLEEQFAQNMSLFDTSLLNRYGDNPDITLSSDLETLITRYENGFPRSVPDKEIIFETIDYLVNLTRETERKKDARDSIVIDRGFVFIIMPMMVDVDSETKDKIDITYFAIKEAASSAGYRAERVDRIPGGSSIDSKIYENIEKAEIIVADLSFERPNCYFELGYARALGKDLIIISREGTKVHFDLEHYDRIEYSSGSELNSELRIKLFQRSNVVGC